MTASNAAWLTASRRRRSCWVFSIAGAKAASPAPAELTARLADIHHGRHKAAAALEDWLRVQWGMAKIPTALASPFDLSPDAFAEALRKVLPKKHKMTVAEVAAIKKEHASAVAPIALHLGEALGLERELSTLVNEAYGLTKEEEALVWRTAPPRMPLSPPVEGLQPKYAAE